MTNQIGNALMGYAVEVIIACLALVCAYLTTYLRKAAARVKAETLKIDDQHDADILQRAIDRVDDVAERVVIKLEQTVAGDLRQSVKEGKFTRDQLLKLAPQAWEETVSIVGPEVIQVLEDSLGDYKEFIGSTIEAKVHKVKLQGVNQRV